jgi:ankyrin repeat protein
MEYQGERFRAVCDALRRNDPELDSVSFRSYPLLTAFPGAIGQNAVAYTFRETCGASCLALCDAMCSNRVVSTITVCIATLAFILEQSVKNITSRRAYNQFLQLVTSHASLRSVSMADTEFEVLRSESIDQFCSDLLSALERSPYIVNLRDSHLLTPTHLASLLRATTTLKSLQIEVPHQGEIFAQGIEGNQSLECLELATFRNAARATRLFRQLRLPPNLRKLILSPGMHATEPIEWSGLSALLPSSSLESLQLSSCFFDCPSWRFFGEALQASSTLTSLSFDSCTFDDGATQGLVRFFNNSSPVTDLHISTSNGLSAVRLSSIVVSVQSDY